MYCYWEYCVAGVENSIVIPQKVKYRITIWFSNSVTKQVRSPPPLESESEVAQSCPTLCNPMDCSLPGSSIHGIFQARVLERVAISFFKGSSRPRDLTLVFCIAGRCFTIWARREASTQAILVFQFNFCISIVWTACLESLLVDLVLVFSS